MMAPISTIFCQTIETRNLRTGAKALVVPIVARAKMAALMNFMVEIVYNAGKIVDRDVCISNFTDERGNACVCVSCLPKMRFNPKHACFEECVSFVVIC